MKNKTFVWKSDGQRRSVDLDQSTNYPTAVGLPDADGRLAFRDFVGRLASSLTGTLRNAYDIVSPSYPTIIQLWHHADGLSFIEYKFSGDRSEPSAFAEVGNDIAEIWFQLGKYESPPTHVAPPYVPSIKQIRSLVDRFWYYIRSIQGTTWPTSTLQEDNYQPWFCGLSDALQPLRPRWMAGVGWPVRVGRYLAVIIERFDDFTREIGWEELTQPEPRRSQYITDRFERFRQAYERPVYEAAISWQEGFMGLDSHKGIDDFADVGRAKGYGPTLTPEDGRAVFHDRHEAFVNAPRLGMTVPSIDINSAFHKVICEFLTNVDPILKKIEHETKPPLPPPSADNPTNVTPASITLVPAVLSTPPASETKFENLSLDSRAVAVAHEISASGKPVILAEVARRLGAERTKVYRDCPTLRSLINTDRAQRQDRKKSIPRGMKDPKTRKVETWQDVLRDDPDDE